MWLCGGMIENRIEYKVKVSRFVGVGAHLILRGGSGSCTSGNEDKDSVWNVDTSVFLDR